MTKRFLASTLLAALAVALVVTLFGQREVRAQTPTPSISEVTRTVSVSGEGQFAATPDQATIELGVRTEGSTAASALTENNEEMTALIAALKAARIAQRDIQTSNLSIWPRYGSSGESVTGYEATNTVRITVRDLSTLGATLDAAVKAGGNQMHGITFGFSNPAALLDQARKAAMEDAQRKATQLATLSNTNLGTVVSISESGSAPAPVMVRSEMAMDASTSVPIEMGESSLYLTVQVTYELAPK